MPAWVAHGRAPAAPRRLRWRCWRLAAACLVRLVGDIRHATAVVHKVFGQENKPGAPVTSSQGARDTNVSSAAVVAAAEFGGGGGGGGRSVEPRVSASSVV
eukprot:COSAG05_NODE_1498_length_4705_cov_11.449197_5_plen_101_part_00